MTTIERDQFFQLRVTGDEKRMLQALADLAGLSASDIIRQLIRREHARIGGGKKIASRRKS